MCEAKPSTASQTPPPGGRGGCCTDVAVEVGDQRIRRCAPAIGRWPASWPQKPKLLQLGDPQRRRVPQCRNAFLSSTRALLPRESVSRFLALLTWSVREIMRLLGNR